MKKLNVLGFLSILLLISCNTYGLITTSTSGYLVFEALEGHGGTSIQEFGLGTPPIDSSPEERDLIFNIHLVNGNISQVTPSSVINMGYYSAGSELDFYNYSSWGGGYWAFSSNLNAVATPSDIVTFTDKNNSLGFGGSVVEVIGIDRWILHLDDAASFAYDDDDNEMVIMVSVVPEPATLSLLVFGGLALLRRGTKQ